MKKYIIGCTILASIVLGCQKMQFDDPTTFTLEEAIAETPDYYARTAAASLSRIMTAVNNGYELGVGLNSYADNITSTNGQFNWWDLAKEPRLRFDNSQTYSGRSHITYPFLHFYQANLDAIKVITGLDAGDIGVDQYGVDRTAEIYSIAYFVKALSQGSLGAIFDRGVVVDEDLGAAGEARFGNSYKELLASAEANFDKALAAANQAPSITLSDFYINLNLDKQGFIELINSMAARTLAATARDKDEARGLGAAFWNKIHTYASNGFTSDYIVTYVTTGFRNGMTEYAQRIQADAGWLPADIKIPYLADRNNSTPTEYSMDPNVVLPPIETDDDRFYDYFGYAPGFGFLQVPRGRYLFSNYYYKRWFQAGSHSGIVTHGVGQNPVFLAEENRLLRAEAKFWLGEYAAAAAELNDPTAERKSLGNLPDIAANEEAIRHTLHYEYSISVASASGAMNPWTFMRRHNLLQPGTPTQLPIPYERLILVDEEPYTFGGIEFAGERGIWGETATAGESWGWKGTR